MYRATVVFVYVYIYIANSVFKTSSFIRQTQNSKHEIRKYFINIFMYFLNDSNLSYHQLKFVYHKLQMMWTVLQKNILKCTYLSTGIIFNRFDSRSPRSG